MIRIGILGTSSHAIANILPGISELKSKYSLVGIGSRSFEKANKIAQNWQTTPYDGYESLLADTQIDAVYIPLPNALHFEWIEKSLLNGKHVIVEKSLSCNYEEVLQLTELAKTQNLVLFENFQFRFHSQLAFIRKIVDSGEIGELRSMSTSFGFPPFKDASNIRYDPALGGGSLYDAGAYPIKLSQIFLGNDLDVKAAKWHVDNRFGVDTWGGGFLESSANDMYCDFKFGFDNYYRCNLDLWGSKGDLYTNRIFTAKPNYIPKITLKNAAGIQEISLEIDNHFVNMLNHFSSLVNDHKTEVITDEHLQNVNQARLLNQFKLIASASE